MNLKIMKLEELNESYRDEVSMLYVESFNNKMKIMRSNNDVLAKVFKHSFDPSMYYIALDDDKLIGIAAVSSHKRRANSFKREVFTKEFGVLKGSFYHFLIKLILEAPEARTEGEGYIESVTTKKEYRGKGIATKLFNYIHENSGYNKFILDVIHGNDNAKKLYETLGYKTYKVDKSILIKIMNVEAMYLMEFDVALENQNKKAV